MRVVISHFTGRDRPCRRGGVYFPYCAGGEITATELALRETRSSDGETVSKEIEKYIACLSPMCSHAGCTVDRKQKVCILQKLENTRYRLAQWKTRPKQVQHLKKKKERHSGRRYFHGDRARTSDRPPDLRTRFCADREYSAVFRSGGKDPAGENQGII